MSDAKGYVEPPWNGSNRDGYEVELRNKARKEAALAEDIREKKIQRFELIQAALTGLCANPDFSAEAPSLLARVIISQVDAVMELLGSKE